MMSFNRLYINFCNTLLRIFNFFCELIISSVILFFSFNFLCFVFLMSVTVFMSFYLKTHTNFLGVFIFGLFFTFLYSIITGSLQIILLSLFNVVSKKLIKKRSIYLFLCCLLGFFLPFSFFAKFDMNYESFMKMYLSQSIAGCIANFLAGRFIWDEAGTIFPQSGNRSGK